MFSNLLELKKDRTTKQAFGFYIAYAIVSMLFLFILGTIMEIIFSIGYENGKKIGYIFAIVVPTTISFMILKRKNAMNFKYVVLALLSGILGLLGVFLGFIPTAYLTTRMSNKYEERNTNPQAD